MVGFALRFGHVRAHVGWIAAVIVSKFSMPKCLPTHTNDRGLTRGIVRLYSIPEPKKKRWIVSAGA